jgi:hypothetical protein
VPSQRQLLDPLDRDAGTKSLSNLGHFIDLTEQLRQIFLVPGLNRFGLGS